MQSSWLKIKPPQETSPLAWLRWVPTVVVSAIILYVLYVVGNVAIIPVLVSFALAYLLSPIAYQFEKRGISRMWSALTAIFLVSLIIVGLLAYVVPELWTQTVKAGTEISKNFTPENAARQRLILGKYSPALESVVGEKLEKFLSKPMVFIEETTATTTIAPNGTQVTETNSGISLILSVLSSSVELLLVPFFVFYILIDFQKWRMSLEDLIPPRFQEPFRMLFDESGRILQSFVLGQIMIGAIMSFFYAIGFWALGIPAWAGIAIITGMLNAVPYVGTVSGLVLASAFIIADGGNAWNVAAVVGVFVAVQSLEGYVLTPRILGERLNLHPMAVFLGLLIGGKLFGFLGVILAIPAIAISKVFFKFFRELYQASYFYHSGDISPNEVPSEKLEERMVEAAETVLTQQEQKDEESPQVDGKVADNLPNTKTMG